MRHSPSFLPSARARLAPAQGPPSAPGLMNSNAFLVAEEPSFLPSFPARASMETDGRTEIRIIQR